MLSVHIIIHHLLQPVFILSMNMTVFIKANPNVALKPHSSVRHQCRHPDTLSGIQENMIRNILHTPGLRAVVLKNIRFG